MLCYMLVDGPYVHQTFGATLMNNNPIPFILLSCCQRREPHVLEFHVANVLDHTSVHSSSVEAGSERRADTMEPKWSTNKGVCNDDNTFAGVNIGIDIKATSERLHTCYPYQQCFVCHQAFKIITSNVPTSLLLVAAGVSHFASNPQHHCTLRNSYVFSFGGCRPVAFCDLTWAPNSSNGQ